MTDRTSADDDLLLEALEALDGDGTGVSTRLAGASPALRAEVDALRAVKGVLDGDAAWGLRSGTDAPPPHLLDAILHAEVAARPDAIRQAVALTVDAPAAPRSLWARMSSWLVGSGVVVGAAAALFITIQRAPGEVAAPAGSAAPTADTKMVSPPLAEDALVGAAATADPATDSIQTEQKREGVANDGPAPDAKPMAQLATPARPDDGDGDFGSVGGAIADNKVQAGRIVDRRGGADASTGASLLDDVSAKDAGGGGFAYVAKKAAPAEAEAQDGLGLATASTRNDAKADAPATVAAPPPPPRDEADALGAVADADAFADDEAPAARRSMRQAPAQTAPSSSPPPAPMPASMAAPEPAPVVAPRVVSAEEARKNFLGKRAQLDAKEEAIAEAREKAKSASSGAKGSADKAKKRPAAESADAARERMFRSQQLQEANGMLVTAERELSQGRFESSIDLAMRAEATAGGGLGLAPASTLVRGYVGLRRYADATRIGSRLLNGNAGDTQLVDGMLAGAFAAEQIGDFRTAERLLTLASSSANTDAPRRAEAQKRLRALRGKGAQAPAKAAVRESAASEPAAAAAVDQE